MTWRRRRTWRASRIGLRLLAFNVLVMFVPIAGVLYLGVYEERLLDVQERAMVQQARILAAALGDVPAIDRGSAQAILDRLGGRNEARMRVFDRRGALIADSLSGSGEQERSDTASRYDSPPHNTRGDILYRLAVVFVRLRAAVASHAPWRSRAGDTATGSLEPSGGLDIEVAAALNGRYGAAIRPSRGQRSLTLFSAVPVRSVDAVIGAVTVSQSTFRILQAIYDVRLSIFRVVIASMIAAALLTTLAATTIVRPLARLRHAASSLAQRRTPLLTPFPGTRRRDEIGDLARALEELTERLSAHIVLLEGFAADVAHEFKNPLAAIRSAAETIDACDNPEERSRFVAFMIRDVGRLERLVSGLRDLARIDRQLEQREAAIVDVATLVHAVADRVRALGARGVRVEVQNAGADCRIAGDGGSLGQVFENLLTNAASFAPDGTAVVVRISRHADDCCVSVSDRGPGIPESHLARVFERFFSYRPSNAPGEHLGLGLAIAKRVVEGHGGTITAGNRADGGATFEVRLPAG